MENEVIKMHEFVRTNSGHIYKLGYYKEEEKRWICFGRYDWYPVYPNQIVKHSFDILDLIEVGDYVNGCLVIEVTDKTFTIIEKSGGVKCHHKESLMNLKHIVTRDAFEESKFYIPDDED